MQKKNIRAEVSHVEGTPAGDFVIVAYADKTTIEIRVNPALVVELADLYRRTGHAGHAIWHRDNKSAIPCVSCHPIEKDDDLFRNGCAHFRRGIRNAISPFYPNNIGTDDDELVRATERLVKEDKELRETLQKQLDAFATFQKLNPLAINTLIPDQQKAWEVMRDACAGAERAIAV